MKKAMAILLAAVLALACTACGGSKSEAGKDRLAQIKERAASSCVLSLILPPMNM